MVGVAETFIATYTGALLSNLIKLLLDNVPNPKFPNYFRQTQLKIERLRELEKLLLTVDKVLGDAEEKQIINYSVKKWVDDLQDVAYDAEDLLDAIATEGKRSRLLKDPTKKQQMEDFNDHLEAVFKKLNPIVEQIDVLGLKEGHGGRSFPRFPTTSLVDESEKCYRENDQKVILDWLCVDNLNMEISVIAIVGMGGIGKTTLAQFVYNNVEVKKEFQLRAWASVSDEFDVFSFTKTIYESVFLSDSNITDLNVLQIRLENRLRGKKFLLVLDNIWNLSFREWDLLRRPLQGADPRSKIIVTTRNRSVSSTMCSIHVHELNRLSKEDCLSLFEKHAFGNEDGDSALKAIGVKIATKCKGLPLAAKTLGSLLRSEAEAEEWNNVLNSKIWDLPDHKSDILGALRFSYHHLPSHLKRCFAYCSIFPKGHKFQKADLVRLWIAEGLVQQPSSKRRMEEVGEKYFDELLSRSMFQQSRGQNQSHFIMHDLVNDLAQHIAGEFCFKFEDDSPPQNPKRVRYLSCILEPVEMVQKFEAFNEVFQGLRTFLSLRSSSKASTSFNPLFFKSLFAESSRLRALSLPCCSITTLPDSIGNLKQLRYLDLSRNEIETLPDGIVSSLNLETLKLSRCHRLTELPTNMKNLTKLEHLDITGTSLKEMPPQFGELKRLQLLTKFVVGSNGSRISEVKELSLLRGSLTIMQLQNVTQTEDAEDANLKDKKYLSELKFEWDADTSGANHDPLEGYETNNLPDPNYVNAQNAEDVLDKLQPAENLESLTIKNFCGMNFPSWVGNALFSKIKSLALINCQNCNSLPSLGRLPSLKDLYIHGLVVVQEVGLEFYGDGVEAFKSLELLRFEEMKNWNSWSPFENKHGFRSLQRLWLTRCPRLTKIQWTNKLPSSCLIHVTQCAQLGMPEGATNL